MGEATHAGRRTWVWIEAARPRTLFAAIVPVVVGTAAAETFVAWRFLCALVVSVGMQVGVNYANDLFDALRGVDAADRVGPRRAVASGLVESAQMKRAMLLVFAVAGAAGCALALAVQPWLIAVGAACVAAALGYSGGPRPYASLALGEVFVFVFFGLVATVGSSYVQDERITGTAIAASLPVGLLAVAILVVNNLRDIDSDRRAGKVTLAVKLGPQATRTLYDALLIGAYATVFVVAAVGGGAAFAALLSVPIAWRARRAVASSRLLPALGATAHTHALFGALLAVGLWIS